MHLHHARLAGLCRSGLLVLGAIVFLLAAPALANAAAAGSISHAVPANVTVGQTGIPMSLSLTNNNTAPENLNTNVVCNAGDAGFCNGEGITLTPSCGAFGMPCAQADPGVFQLSSPAMGRPFTDCAGVLFTVAVSDPTFGTYRFTPTSGNVTIAAGSACAIDFTADVLKMPTIDANVAPGLQTASHAYAQQYTSGSSVITNGQSTTTVQPNSSSTIATTASAGIVLGGAGQLTDQATVSGRVSPQPGASITFRLYGPGDTTCSSAPFFTSFQPYPVGGGPVTSAGFTPTQAGTYRWVATYSGDANNAGVSGACNDANENVIVSPAAPTIATNASGSIVLGGAGSLTDVATVSGRVNPLPGATVTWVLYGPGDTTCTGTPVFAPAPVPYPGAGGPITSPAFTPTQAGTYRWIASYSGDGNNSPTTGACNDANENVVVSPAVPTIATTASAGIALGGGTLTDTATVSGRVNPQPGATVTFRLYGPNDATCAGAPVFTSIPVAYPVIGGAVASSAFTPTQAGTYRWRATYSGDANNSSVAGACNDANENVVVAKATPTVATNASGTITLGSGTVTDTVVVSGLVNPQVGGSVDFNIYAPGDTTCSSALWGSARPYPPGSGAVTSAPYTPTIAGTYRWRAFYNGDANNNIASGACNAPNESVIVLPASPTIATSASANVVLGEGTLTDSATVSGRVDPQPGGTITFRLYGPDDAACASAAVFAPAPVAYPVGGGAVASPAFTPTQTGAYRWIASYSGDVNNAAASGACNDAGESAVVTQRSTTTSLTLSSTSGTSGSTATFTASVAGGSTPTGTVTFRDGASTIATVALGSGGSASTSTSTLAVGTHSISANYGSDANHTASTSAAVTYTVTAAQDPEVPVDPTLAVTNVRVVGSCISPERRDVILRYTLEHAARVTYTVQRRTLPVVRPPATCPRLMTGTTVKNPRFLTVARSIRSIGAGINAIRLSQLVRVANLQPGTYRINMRAVRPNGVASRTVSFSFVVTS